MSTFRSGRRCRNKSLVYIFGELGRWLFQNDDIRIREPANVVRTTTFNQSRPALARNAAPRFQRIRYAPNVATTWVGLWWR